MASPTLITPAAAAAAAATSKPLPPVKSKLTSNPTITTPAIASLSNRRRDLIALSAGFLLLSPVKYVLAASDEEYAKDTSEAIEKVRTTLNLDKNDSNIAAAVSELREISNGWVAMYRKEKTLLSRSSFREMYSALNAVSGHYISFGPTAPIPTSRQAGSPSSGMNSHSRMKRKQRILEEMDTAEKALGHLQPMALHFAPHFALHSPKSSSTHCTTFRTTIEYSQNILDYFNIKIFIL